MEWETVKKYLYRHGRVSELCNKGTGNEVLTTWNGLMLLEWSPESWVNDMWRSGRPRKKINTKGEVVGYEPSPTKVTVQLKLF